MVTPAEQSLNGEGSNSRFSSNDQDQELGGNNLEVQSRSSADNQFGQGGSNDQGRGKRKFQRHTDEQITELEACFKRNPHLDVNERTELGRRLGLDATQIRFWLQNKRTQVKVKGERDENKNLRDENERLRALNLQYKEDIKKQLCRKFNVGCTTDEMSTEKFKLTQEYIRLKEEKERYLALLAEYSLMDKAPAHDNIASPHSVDLVNASSSSSGDNPNLLNGMTPKKFEEAIAELARLATEELKVMAVATEPLWLPSSADGGTSRFLNRVAYRNIFPNIIGPTQVGFTSEASRETVTVRLSPKRLVKILMDVTQWSVMFSAIVAKATTFDVLNNPGGATDYDGTLQVMAAEYQFPAPLVPNRESYFARYCKQHSERDWTVVDVSLDSVHQVPGMWCKKRPSGCLIHGLSDGSSKITWIEHVDVLDYKVVSTIYKSLLVSGLGFGAKRWVSTLDRQCQRTEITDISLNVPLSGYNHLLMSSQKGRKGVLKLAERMVINFHSGISGSTGKWEKLPGPSAENIRVMIRRNADDPGLPKGTIVTAATSFWLPMSPKSVFDFFLDHNSRREPLIPYTTRKRDVLSDGNVIEQVCHIPSGQEAGNCVSLHKVQTKNSSRRDDIVLLQESCSDPVASYIVYSPIDTKDINLVINGENPDYPPILPSGFAVIPNGPASGKEGLSGGSLLTVSFQLLVDKSPTFRVPADILLTRKTNLIKCTTERIKVALGLGRTCACSSERNC